MNLIQIINKLKIRKWIKNGLSVGNNFSLQRGAKIDSAFPWLVEIGNNVTIAPDSLILSHDGSTKKVLGYSRIGKVVISDNVFIGAKCIILPNTKIGTNSIVGAGSIVCQNVPDNVVVAGNPARIICSLDEFRSKNNEILKKSNMYDKKYTRKGKISNTMKEEMKKALDQKIGYIV